MNLKNNKGNKIAQRKRRKERLKCRPKRRSHEYELIDGNYSFYPVAECKYHKAYLTQGLIDTHNCIERECKRFVLLEDDLIES